MEFSISQMKAMQRELYALHKNTWSAREPDFGNEHILYMVEEIGEVVAILKKKGERRCSGKSCRSGLRKRI